MKSWKNHRAIPIFSAIAILGVMSLSYQNCARAKFSIDPAAKSEALGKENVFDRDQGDDGNVGGGRPGDDSNIPGGGRPGDDSGVPGKNPQGNDPSTTSLDITFRFICSNAQSNSNGGNLLTASSVKILISKSMASTPLCELTGDYKNDILNKKKINYKPCGTLAAGNYYAFIVDSAVSSSDPQSVALKSLTDNDIRFKVNADGTYNKIGGSRVDILYDINKSNSMYDSLVGKFASTDETQAKCDSRVSPLIISMNSAARGIKLTSPLDGIQFDILGERSFPMAHDKKQISWLMPNEQEYYFITLPNKSGDVLGVNELFGDNTRGPDGKFADNGYAALAKYDDDKDKLITSDDEVFEKLRIWGDKNRDGIAQSDELLPLSSKSIEVIDLKFDKRYKETDQYGNQTLMKSVVKTEDGKLHLVFDLWFRYLNITK